MWFGSKSTDYYVNSRDTYYPPESQGGFGSLFRRKSISAPGRNNHRYLDDARHRRSSLPTHHYDTQYHAGLPPGNGLSSFTKPFHDLDYYQQQGHTFLPHPPQPMVHNHNPYPHYGGNVGNYHGHHHHEHYGYPREQQYIHRNVAVDSGYYPYTTGYVERPVRKVVKKIF
ncbi:hypothetical protein G6F70_007823 [Rhizopus microsporus]|uniref:Uncharacterized protein n=2 Tax=Rhizopus TaxID=4842 RepID=A0A367J191_RHIAZ|nr:hypothetical protein G6F71_007781 [Rhizopus microsporus]RCH83680.1 hypothetical protein CU097_003701 [Rhizopus azygosporus]KAG1195960.1 hypothetical protein G6F70_007823 [Rhizopus microsporus]KAG1208189.1 hypothetical protein G6F69_007430 [Rhizopus microsporus]KAG1229449.1 hypothetical protein G6F67_007142 [Rhizopus microsporus]